MKDKSKTKQELIEELDYLKQRVVGYVRLESTYKIVEKRLHAINECLLSLGNDMGENISRLTTLTGELLGATAAIYNRLEGDLLIAIGQWQTPPDFRTKDRAQGHICYDVIRKNEERIIHIRNLAASSYAESDPNVCAYGLATYVGHVVRWGSEPIGSLCVVFQQDYIPTADDERLLGIMASSIGEQEKRWRNENALRKSEDKYRTLIETTDTGFVIIDQDGLVQDANSEYVRITGRHDLNEIVGRSVMEWTADYEKEKNEAAVKACFEKGHIRNFEIDYVDKDGKITPIELNATCLKIDGKVQTITICRDITERKKATEEIEASEERLRMLSTLATEGIMIREGSTIIDANQAFAKLCGYSSPVELIGKNGVDVIPFTPDSRQKIIDRIRADKTGTYDVNITAPDGSVLSYEVNGQAVPFPYKGKQARIVFMRDITARKKAEEELQKLVSIVRHSSELINLATPDGKMIFLNEAGCRILGIDPDRVGKFNIQNVIPEHMLPMVRSEILPALMSGGTWEGELQYKNIETGNLTDVFAMTFTIKDPVSNAPIYFANVSRDITDRKRAEAQKEAALATLQESEEKYRILLSESPDPIFSFTPEGQYRYVNRAFAEGVAKPVEDIIGKTMWDVFPKDEADKRFASLSHVFRTGEEKVIEVRVPRADGDRYYVTTITPIKDTNGKTSSVICASKDITDRKWAEEELAKSEDKFRKVFYTSPDVMSITRVEDGMYISINPGFTKIMGYTEKDIVGKSSVGCNIWVNIEDRQRLVAGLKKDGEVNNLEATFRTKDGDIRYGLISATVINLNGVSHLLGIVRDITDRRRMEEETRRLEERLQRAEKMEALGTLAGGVAHDLNNVLGVIIGYSELLLNEVDKLSPFRLRLTKIMDGTEKAAAIVQDLLTLARRGVSGRKVFNLNKLVLDYQNSPEWEKLFSYNSAVQIKINLEPDLLNISGSPVHLGKTLFNLVTNAAEAMAKGGELTIRTSNQYLDKSIYGYDEIREGDYVVLSVTDTGEGISATDMQRIFEPFYTKKVMGRSGTGLGLAVVWGTVKDHQGYINVQSEEGKGSTFTLYFPVTRENVTAESLPVSVSEYRGKGETILVVDDVREQRELAMELLKKLNYQVASAASGEEAIAYLKEHTADLLVLDMIMEPGIDGLDTYKSILEIRPKQKAIIVSGFSETERVNEAHALGAGAYLRKPYIMEKLGMAVRKELDCK